MSISGGRVQVPSKVLGTKAQGNLPATKQATRSGAAKLGPFKAAGSLTRSKVRWPRKRKRGKHLEIQARVYSRAPKEGECWGEFLNAATGAATGTKVWGGFFV